MDVKNQNNEMPVGTDLSAGNVQQQYFTADEAMAYLEPRIRAMFK